MKLTFRYHSESPFLMPGYSRYYEVVEGRKHVGMIHLAHKDWEGEWSHDDGKSWDIKMPHEVEITITAISKGHVKIEEGHERKGGRNTSTRITERPAPPQPMEKPNALTDVRSSKGGATRPAEKPKASPAPARDHRSADKDTRKRKSGTRSIARGSKKKR